MENEQEHLFTKRDGEKVYGTRRPSDEEMKAEVERRNREEHEYALKLSQGIKRGGGKKAPDVEPEKKPQAKPAHPVPHDHPDREWPKAA